MPLNEVSASLISPIQGQKIPALGFLSTEMVVRSE